MARGSVGDLIKDSLNDVFDPNTKWPDREVEEVKDREGGESSGSDSSESDSSSPSLSDEDEEDDDIRSMEEGGSSVPFSPPFEIGGEIENVGDVLNIVDVGGSDEGIGLKMGGIERREEEGKSSPDSKHPLQEEEEKIENLDLHSNEDATQEQSTNPISQTNNLGDKTSRGSRRHSNKSRRRTKRSRRISNSQHPDPPNQTKPEKVKFIDPPDSDHFPLEL